RDTQKLAQRVYKQIQPIIGIKAIIIALEGPLGAGKTTFTKALAKHLGVTDPVLSPTFVLHGEYGRLDHLDLWRVDQPQELIDLGLLRMVTDKKVIIIEWAEKACQEILRFADQAEIMWIKFEYGDRPNERRISLENLSH
ncbi:MAG: tRNA (adenosine(37)-N6)-threonylcarbamoyltransferase complex ATPase subunit type 1 TsaE, partial [bacterium]|nr:tRNA (adenosine(37)-N6)-threonylcarbamoyltransferase complex ATPase subunit type 1 TsaE [bacterium]